MFFVMFHVQTLVPDKSYLAHSLWVIEEHPIEHGKS